MRNLTKTGIKRTHDKYQSSVGHMQSLRHRLLLTLKSGHLHFLIVITSIMLGFIQEAHAQSTTDRFLWDQANTQMIHASTPEDYLKAAETYRRLLADGIVNPALLNNLGCALTMGGDYANAKAAYERAERFSGTTIDTIEGLKSLAARKEGTPDIEAPWYRTAFFWHFGLPARLRIFTALSGWILLWLGILLYILRKRNTHHSLTMLLTFSETCMITGSLIFLLFGASSIFSILQEKQDESYWLKAKFITMESMEELR